MPLCLQRPHQLPLLLRGHPAEDGIALRRPGQGRRVAEGPGVHPGLRPGDARPLRHLRHRQGVVAGDHLHGNSLPGKIAEGLRGGGAELVVEKQQGDGQEGGAEGRVAELPVVVGQEQHPAAFGGPAGNFLRILRVILPQENLRGPQEVGLVPVEADAPVLPGGGEGQGGDGLLPGALLLKIAAQGGHGVVVVPEGGHVIGHDEGGVLGGVALRAEGDHPLHRHFGFRDGAGLIHAERVHPGQGLDAFQLVDQGLLSRQPQHPGAEGHGGQKVEALGDHAHQGPHRRHHPLGVAPAQGVDLLPVEQQPHGNQQQADPLHQAAQVPHHPGLFFPAAAPGGQGEAVGVGVGPHRRKPGQTASRHQKAAGAQAVPGLFRHLLRLPGDEGLVYLAVPGEDLRVGADLVPPGEAHHVPQHQAGGIHLPLPALPEADAAGSVQEAQRVQNFFAVELLDDADAQIDEHRAHEHEVVPGADGHQKAGQDKKHQIKIGEDVSRHNLGHRLPRGVHGGVVQAPAPALPGLPLRQTGDRL